MNDGIIVEVKVVVGVEGSRVLFERFRPPHDTVLKRYRVAVHVVYRTFVPVQYRTVPVLLPPPGTIRIGPAA